VKNCAEILLHTLNFVKVNFRGPVPYLGKVEREWQKEWENS
jgi:hypothetical protein